MLSCLVGEKRINLFDKKYDKLQLKKWADKNILICPACNKPYEYCHGVVKTPYFRHKDKQECIDLYSETETQEHLRGKMDIYNWLIQQEPITDVELEGWLPLTKQRPDIMFKCNGEQYVIEYQCTPISTEYHERHELYQASGIKDVWILGTLKYLQLYHDGHGSKRVSEIEKYTEYYYDSINEMMLFRDSNIPSRMNKKTYNLMDDKFSLYKTNYPNILSIKNSSLDYDYKWVKNWNCWSKYQPKNVKKYCYIKNYSRAYCKKLDEMKLGGFNG